MTEKEIQNQIVDYLNKSGLGYFFTVDNKGTFDPTKKVFRRRSKNSMPKGVADILGVSKGQFCALEVKRKSTRNRTTTDQDAFLAAVRSCGGRAGICWDIESALLIVTGDLLQ